MAVNLFSMLILPVFSGSELPTCAQCSVHMQKLLNNHSSKGDRIGIFSAKGVNRLQVI